MRNQTSTGPFLERVHRINRYFENLVRSFDVMVMASTTASFSIPDVPAAFERLPECPVPAH